MKKYVETFLLPGFTWSPFIFPTLKAIAAPSVTSFVKLGMLLLATRLSVVGQDSNSEQRMIWTETGDIVTSDVTSADMA